MVNQFQNIVALSDVTFSFRTAQKKRHICFYHNVSYILHIEDIVKLKC